MKRLAFSSLASCLLISGIAGCSAHTDTVRGQNPHDAALVPQYASQQMGANYNEAQIGTFANFAHNHRMNNHPASCPTCPQGMHSQMWGPGGSGNYLWQNAAAQNKVWKPTHNHTYEFSAPKNLLYPPANQPAAMVQYPYYTIKSPTDFFYK
ncbi:MAG: hypothetical protein CMJ78_17930 [Planctomycetaceae bacterium]|nr:hypothetical protein [Planctomycetaceae bacterium]